MSDFNIARKNMIHNQLMTNNIGDDYILKAFKDIPREIFLPSERRTKTLKLLSSIFAAYALPAPIPKPCPKEPVDTSTPGTPLCETWPLKIEPF